MNRLRAALVFTTLASTAIFTACGANTVLDASQTLREAFEQAGTSDAYRVTGYSGQTIQVDGLGLDVDQPLDTTTPFIVTEVDGDGETRTALHVDQLLPTEVPGFEDLTLELWQDEARIVGDTTAYSAITDLDPTADLGPFRPGVWSVDLDAVGAESDDLVELLAGNSALDPAALGASFLDQISKIEVDENDPTRYTASTTYGNVVRANGQSVDSIARTLAAGIAPQLGADPQRLAALVVDVYENAPAELEVVIVDGVLQSLEMRSDLAGLWSAMATTPEAFGLELTAEEKAEFTALFAGASQTVTLRSEFTSDDSIDVAMPADGGEDRTAEFITFLQTVAGD
jgi:hypothetical protein